MNGQPVYVSWIPDFAGMNALGVTQAVLACDVSVCEFGFVTHAGCNHPAVMPMQTGIQSM